MKYIHIQTYTYVHAYVHTSYMSKSQPPNIYEAHACTNIHTYIHANVHTFIYAYIFTYIHTYIHTCTHTLQSDEQISTIEQLRNFNLKGAVIVTTPQQV